MLTTNKKVIIIFFILISFCSNSYADNNILGKWSVVDSNDKWIFNGNTVIIELFEEIVAICKYNIQNNKIFIEEEGKDIQEVSYEIIGDNLLLGPNFRLTRQRTSNLTLYDGFDWVSFFVNLRDMVFSPWVVRNNRVVTRAMNLLNAGDYETAREFGDETMIRPLFLLILLIGRDENIETKTKEIELLFSNTHNRNMELSQYAVEITRMFMNNDIQAMKRIILYSNNGYEYSKYFD
jgi:hypothetical protein